MKTTSETGPSWDRYRLLKEDHDREWEAKKPIEPKWSDYNFVTPMNRHLYEQHFQYRMARYTKELSQWVFESSVSAPTKPNAEYSQNH